MFCSFCGKPADGNYCEHCGHKLRDSAPTELIKPEVTPLELVDGTPVYDADALLDDENQWAHEVNYKTLVRHPDVRDLLVMANNRAHAGMTGEEFLKKFDSAIPGLSIATSTSTTNICRVPCSSIATNEISVPSRFQFGDGSIRSSPFV